MKRFYLIVLLAGLAVSGCAAQKPRDNTGPLDTSGETRPLPGCEDLRKRGGAC